MHNKHFLAPLQRNTQETRGSAMELQNHPQPVVQVIYLEAYRFLYYNTRICLHHNKCCRKLYTFLLNYQHHPFGNQKMPLVIFLEPLFLYFIFEKSLFIYQQQGWRKILMVFRFYISHSRFSLTRRNKTICKSNRYQVQFTC